MTIFKHSHTSHHSHDTSRNKNSNSFQVSHKFPLKCLDSFLMGFNTRDFPRCFRYTSVTLLCSPARTVTLSTSSRPFTQVSCRICSGPSGPFTVYCLPFTVYRL